MDFIKLQGIKQNVLVSQSMTTSENTQQIQD